jgi:hypothetical protein
MHAQMFVNAFGSIVQDFHVLRNSNRALRVRAPDEADESTMP